MKLCEAHNCKSAIGRGRMYCPQHRGLPTSEPTLLEFLKE